MNMKPANLPRSPRRAFGLLELVVVVAILGVLIALLLPAIGAAREAARRANCMSNMRQVGMAVMGYSSQNAESIPVGIAKTTRHTAQARLLPFLEMGEIHRLFDFSKTADANTKATEVFLPIYACPSDKNLDQFKSPGGGVYARSNYVFCFGSDTMALAAPTRLGILRFNSCFKVCRDIR